MLRQVAWAVLAVLLLLFNARTALASRECSCETGHNLVSLECQAGEVFEADPGTFTSSDQNEMVETYANILNGMNLSAKEATFSASGASGVSGSTAGILLNDLGHEYWRHEAAYVIGRCRGSGA